MLDVLYVFGIIAYFGLVVGSLRLLERLVRHREDDLADTAELEVSPDYRISGRRCVTQPTTEVEFGMEAIRS